jgi:biotin operon repressor
MEGNSITRGRGKSRKTIGKTIKEYLEVNGLDIKMIYNRNLSCRLSHLVDPN